MSNHDERHGHDQRLHDHHHQGSEYEQHRPPYAPQHNWRHHQARYGDRARRSGPLRWCVAVVFTVLAVAVLIAAVTILLVVLLLQPQSPYFAVRSARLDALAYDDTRGVLDNVQVSALVEARNGNAHARAAFSELEVRVAFAGTVLAMLRAEPFVVRPGGRLPLAYVARARGAQLGEAGSAAMQAVVRDGVVPLSLEGEARTRWRLAWLVDVRRWTRLGCQISFGWPNGTALDFRCRSKSTSWFF
jgi:hypothetical protein